MKRRFWQGFGAVQQVRTPFLVGGLVVMFGLFLWAWYVTTPEMTLLIGLAIAIIGPPLTVWAQEVVDFNFSKERA